MKTIFPVIFIFLYLFSEWKMQYLISPVIFQTVIFVFFLQNCHFFSNVIDDVGSHFLHSEILALLCLWWDRGLYVILVKICSRSRNHSVPLICSFLFIRNYLIDARTKNDAFSHKFDDCHKLKENLHETYSKLRNLHKLTRIFNLWIDKQIPISST